jgi:hypothetical protein
MILFTHNEGPRIAASSQRMMIKYGIEPIA